LQTGCRVAAAPPDEVRGAERLVSVTLAGVTMPDAARQRPALYATAKALWVTMHRRAIRATMRSIHNLSETLTVDWIF